jgi:hypothetical protein
LLLFLAGRRIGPAVTVWLKLSPPFGYHFIPPAKFTDELSLAPNSGCQRERENNMHPISYGLRQPSAAFAQPRNLKVPTLASLTSAHSRSVFHRRSLLGPRPLLIPSSFALRPSALPHRSPLSSTGQIRTKSDSFGQAFVEKRHTSDTPVLQKLPAIPQIPLTSSTLPPADTFNCPVRPPEKVLGFSSPLTILCPMQATPRGCAKVQPLIAFCFFLLLSGKTGQAAEFSFTCQTWLPKTALHVQAAPEGWTIGKKRLLYYRVRFLDTVENEPVSVEEAEDSLTQTNDRYVRMSYGQFSLEWTITPLIQLDHDTAYYRDAGFAGLLFETRNAAEKVGYHYADFDLDMVRCPQIPGFPQGQANIGYAGAVVSADYPSVYVHELGHNLGLFHANSWQNTRPALNILSSPPFPSNISEYGPETKFDPASLLGNGDLRSPGQSVEYGDSFDTMGSGAGDFNAAFKSRIHWLAPAQVKTVSADGIYRIYAHDQGSTDLANTYAVRLPPLVDGRGQNFTFRYWLSFRAVPPNDIPVPLGIQLHWIDQSESYTGQLLDMQPATPQLAWDSALPIGRTYTDWEAGFHVTPLAAGKDETGVWADVKVSFGIFEKNRPPSLALTAPKAAAPAEPIDLFAAAEDPDGDSLAYFWNFGDGTYDWGKTHVQKYWNKPGQYLVRCEVTDGKGARAIRQALVRVGETSGLVIQGHVRTALGVPIASVLVSNGKVDPSGMLSDYVMGETDSDGLYILPNLAPGAYDVGAQSYGWTTQRTDGGGAIKIDGSSPAIFDFIAEPIPKLTVEFSATRVNEGESAQLTFRRNGVSSSSLEFLFLANGTAGINQDYTSFGSQRLSIPAGGDSISIPFEALKDLDEDPDEQVLITAVPVDEIKRLIPGREGPREISYYYPGWDPRVTTAGETWFQTAPSFQRGPGSTATITIGDTTPPGIQRISVLNESGIAYERPRQEVPLRITRFGSAVAPLEIRYQIGGTALNGIDYDRVPETATIPDGSDHVDVTIAPISDDILEGDETVEFTLLPSDKYLIDGNSYVLLTIQEDEFHSTPQQLHFGFRWGGGVVVQLHGEHGITYLLETSDDLRHWLPWSTNTIDFSPIGIPIPPLNEGTRFYRSAQIP